MLQMIFLSACSTFDDLLQRALSGCQIEGNPVLRAGCTWAQAARVMSFQKSKALLRAARYERAEIRCRWTLKWL